MKPVVSIALLLSLVAVRPLVAEEPPTRRPDFSAAAAGIPDLVRADVARARRAHPAPVTPQPAPPAKRSFWKTPWPYVIAAGVAGAVIYVVARDKDGSGY
jgi:hypothetical protein